MRMKFGLASALLLAALPLLAQTAASRIPRMADGKPNLNGIWQTMNTANWDLLTHGPAMAPVVAMGAQAATPPGLGVVEGNEIPYLPAAAKIKEENSKKIKTPDIISRIGSSFIGMEIISRAFFFSKNHILK